MNPDAIKAAYQRIAPHVRRTPVLDLPAGALGPFPVSMKLEFLQHTGSFKPRGAFNNLLSRAIGDAGIAAASGGNHGAAAAFAARQLGHEAHIFVPTISDPVKIERIKSYGAAIHVEGADYAAALALCDDHCRRTGAVSVHAYDAPETIAGQGTVGLEWSAQADHLDTVLVAVGGGGLIAGIAAWFAGKARVVGVEPVLAPTLHSALAAGGPVDIEARSLANDSLGARRSGNLVHQIAAQWVDQVVLVEDAAIPAAQAHLWRDYRIASEPGGATAFAALLSGAYRPAEGERLGILLCGANVQLAGLDSTLA